MVIRQIVLDGIVASSEEVSSPEQEYAKSMPSTTPPALKRAPVRPPYKGTLLAG
jgi:hypothetical protein